MRSEEPEEEEGTETSQCSSDEHLCIVLSQQVGVHFVTVYIYRVTLYILYSSFKGRESKVHLVLGLQ